MPYQSLSKLPQSRANPTIRLAGYLVLGCLIVGCGQADTQPEPTQAPAKPSGQAHRQDPEGVKSKPKPAPVSVEAEQPRTLDLSRDHLDELMAEPGDTELQSAENLMPEMFGEQKAPRKVQLDGSLITNEEALTLQDKIDGVEIKVEFATP